MGLCCQGKIKEDGLLEYERKRKREENFEKERNREKMEENKRQKMK